MLRSNFVSSRLDKRWFRRRFDWHNCHTQKPSYPMIWHVFCFLWGFRTGASSFTFIWQVTISPKKVEWIFTFGHLVSSVIFILFLSYLRVASWFTLCTLTSETNPSPIMRIVRCSRTISHLLRTRPLTSPSLVTPGFRREFHGSNGLLGIKSQVLKDVGEGMWMTWDQPSSDQIISLIWSCGNRNHGSPNHPVVCWRGSSCRRMETSVPVSVR